MFNLRVIVAGSLCIISGYSTIVLAESENPTSLRGSTPIKEESAFPTMKRIAKDGEPIERNYVQQPPLIPHKIKGYQINLKFNKCLTCHSWANYKQSGATKVSQTHFSDRNNDVLANVAPRRYFCTLCHVTQVNAKPLVENSFKPVSSIKISR